MWFLAAAVFGGLAAAAPVTADPCAPANTACAAVSASSASQVKASPSATPIVDASTAYDCLTSVPIRKDDALKLLNGILPYVEWQSTTSYLKNPPEGYLEPAVDLHAEFAGVKSKIEDGTYSNEYEFQADLFRVFNLAHDGHFRFFPDLLTGTLSFQRGVGLVSVSLDGKSLPEVYTHDDMIAYAGGNKDISCVKSINGKDAVEYLKDFSQLGALQDPDALYNAMFYSKAFAASQPDWDGYFAGSGRFGYIFPGLNTTIDFQNGTSRTWHTTSKVIGDFSGVTDGDSLYEKFCLGKPDVVAPAPATTVAPGPASTPYTPISSPTVTGYPEPVITTSDDIVSGYYLDGTNTDVAVLSMLAMESASPAEFQAVVQDFLADAKQSGKKKLVIDVSANGGGYILLGYDVFRQLFPTIEQDGNTRYRSSEGFQAIAAQYSKALENYDPDTAGWQAIEAAESPLFWKYDLNITNQHFPSEQNKVGPYEFNNDNFTNLMRWDLNDPLTTSNTTFGMGMDITGYRSRTNFTQPFAAEDIIVLYDGYCASTCTLLAEFLRTQAGVKSIAIGGRPSKDGMQAVGGVKGANNADFSFQNQLATFAYDSLSPDQQNSSEAEIFKSYDLYPYYRATGTSINIRDNILKENIEDGLPTHFIYEKADCRIYYQPDMITDVSAQWQMAANVAWGNATCVEGQLDLPKRPAPTGSSGSGSPHRVSRPSRNFPVIEKTSMWTALHGQKVPL